MRVQVIQRIDVPPLDIWWADGGKLVARANLEL